MRSAIVRIVFVLLAVLSLSGGAVLAAGKQGVVIQVSDNDPARWNLALNNAKNIQQDLGKDSVDVEIVAYGPGLNMLKFESEVGNRLTEANQAGIVLIACGNTMKAQKVTEKDLHDGVKVVPAGVIEIMKKQQAGWAYIRP